MLVSDFSDYIAALKEKGLIKVTAVFDSPVEDDEGGVGDLVCTETKETYSFGDEKEADALINEERTNDGFEAASKKFKAGKTSKSGDVVRPDAWIVVIKLNK
jgi:hypothetical protein